MMVSTMRLGSELPVLQMKEMMEKAGNSHLLTFLSYPNAGHLIEPPYTPHTRASNFRTVILNNSRMSTFIFGLERL